jgi:hypothetical protein
LVEDYGSRHHEVEDVESLGTKGERQNLHSVGYDERREGKTEEMSMTGMT